MLTPCSCSLRRVPPRSRQKFSARSSRLVSRGCVKVDIDVAMFVMYWPLGKVSLHTHTHTLVSALLASIRSRFANQTKESGVCELSGKQTGTEFSHPFLTWKFCRKGHRKGFAKPGSKLLPQKFANLAFFGYGLPEVLLVTCQSLGAWKTCSIVAVRVVILGCY